MLNQIKIFNNHLKWLETHLDGKPVIFNSIDTSITPQTKALKIVTTKFSIVIAFHNFTDTLFMYVTYIDLVTKKDTRLELTSPDHSFLLDEFKNFISTFI